ncbi:LysM peptidoglycan-binding domain-containing protein [Nocardia niwae]|uniref:LysM peptidoglycan-binding domain-containing protein n=1 Tax=Nocardia niwae TaxID=626084 RepID=UPI000A01370F|nr:LysM peptidoglycan-binding domain-containing protein [Nocardia niwae]
MINTHTLVAGDSLAAIAKRYYGQEEFFKLIAAASGIRDFNAIEVGMVLIIPDVNRKHTVAVGESLADLAAQFYGPRNSHLFSLIVAANGIGHPDEIRVGQVLIIPGISYRIASGDTLHRLAERFYGDATLFPLIADANGISDPGRIRIGQELLIPPKD